MNNLTNYEELVDLTSKKGVIVVEEALPKGTRGLYIAYADGLHVIAIEKTLTDTDKYCVLAEEIAHYQTSGINNITSKELSTTFLKKVETVARRLCYERLASVDNLIQCFKKGIANRAEMAAELGVTEQFLMDALKSHAVKYGPYMVLENYYIVFSPFIVMEMFAENE